MTSARAFFPASGLEHGGLGHDALGVDELGMAVGERETAAGLGMADVGGFLVGDVSGVGPGVAGAGGVGRPGVVVAVPVGAVGERDHGRWAFDGAVGLVGDVAVVAVLVFMPCIW